MSAFLHNFALSFKSIKKVRTIVLTALLTAIGVVLEMLTNFSLLGGAVQVKLSFIPIGICGMLLGPVPAMICGFLTDFLRATLFPTGAYLVSLSLCQTVMGFVYGAFFFRQKITLKRIALTAIINFLLTTLVLKSLALAPIYYANDFLLTLKLRLWYVVLLPLEIVAFRLLNGPIIKYSLK